MNIFLRLQTIFITALILISCTKKEEEGITTYQQNQIDDSVYLKANNDLKDHYNALSGKDSTIKFTYHLQEKLQNENRPIGIKGVIKDIVKTDTSYLLILTGLFMNKSYVAYVKLTKQQLKEISEKRVKRGFFIVQLKSVSSNSLLSMQSLDRDDEADGESASAVTYDLSEVLLILKGSLIESSFKK